MTVPPRTCASCRTDNAADARFCRACGQSLSDAATVATGASAPTSPLLAPPTATGPVVAGQEPVRDPNPAATDPATRSRAPLILSVVLTLAILAAGAVVAVVLTRGGSQVSTSPSTTAGGSPASSIGSSTGSTDAPAATPAPGSTPASAPKVVAGGKVTEGRTVTISFSVLAPEGHPASQCTGKVDAQEYPIACDLPFVARDLDYGSQHSFEIIARNDAGASDPLRESATIPNARLTVIRQCYPPPCEPVALHAAPRRQIPERGMSVLDGDVVEVECWLTGSSENTRFDDPQRGARYTQIFYRLTNGRYIWAPFVVDEFELPAPGIRPC